MFDNTEGTGVIIKKLLAENSLISQHHVCRSNSVALTNERSGGFMESGSCKTNMLL